MKTVFILETLGRTHDRARQDEQSGEVKRRDKHESDEHKRGVR